MSQSEYERVADRDMNLLHENLEILVEQYTPDGAAWEVEYDVSLCGKVKFPPSIESSEIFFHIQTHIPPCPLRFPLKDQRAYC